MNKKNQTGFTIIELSIATLVFSVLLAICMAVFLQVGRLFIKGVNVSITQEDSRNVIDSIANDIKFSQQSPDLSHINDASNPFFCVGLHRYKFHLFQQLDSSNSNFTSNYGLVRENMAAGCPTPADGDGATSSLEMLGNGMQLNLMQFGPTPSHTCNGNVCTVTINVLFYGAGNDVFTSSEHPNDPQAALKDPDAHCQGSLAGSQFCANTNYSSTILQSF